MVFAQTLARVSRKGVAENKARVIPLGFAQNMARAPNVGIALLRARVFFVGFVNDLATAIRKPPDPGPADGRVPCTQSGTLVVLVILPVPSNVTKDVAERA